MEITYALIVSIVTYVLDAITKIFINKIPNKYIPIQNVIIGVISGWICYWTQIEKDFFQSIILCLMASTAAGGIAELMKTNKNNDKIKC